MMWAVVINASGTDGKVLGVVGAVTGLVPAAGPLIEAVGLLIVAVRLSRIGWSGESSPNRFREGAVGGWGGLRWGLGRVTHRIGWVTLPGAR